MFPYILYLVMILALCTHMNAHMHTHAPMHTHSHVTPEKKFC